MPGDNNLPEMTIELYLHWLGLLGLIGEVSVYVEPEERETIWNALEDAKKLGAPITFRRILNHIEVGIDRTQTSRIAPTKN